MSTHDVLIRPKPYDKRHPYYATHEDPVTNYPDLIVEGNSSEYQRMVALGTVSMTLTNTNIGTAGMGNGSVVATKGENLPYTELICNGVRVSIKPGATVTVPAIFEEIARNAGFL